MKKNLESIRLVFDSSLVAGNAPPVITMESMATNQAQSLADKIKSNQLSDTDSFFFFFGDSSGPAFTNFYPDVKVDNVSPKDEFYIYPVYRSLSEVIIPRWSPLDFSKKGVLKASMGKLYAKPLYRNHTPIMGEELGVVFETFWQDAYQLGDITVPAGINSRLKIDTRLQPNIAALIQMEPSPIQSVSVTVTFTWEKSHPKLDDDVFFAQMGKVVEGELVRKVVNEIKGYDELSFVTAGADKFALKVGVDGKVEQPNKITERNSFSYRVGDFTLYMGESSKPNYEGFTRLSNEYHIDSKSQEDSNNQEPTKKMDKLLISLGLAATATEQDALTALQALVAKSTKLEGELANLKSKADELDVRLSARREVVEANYRLSLGKDGKESATFMGIIKKASFEELEALDAEYLSKIEAAMPLHCNTCGSTSLSRATASPSTEGDNLGDKETKEEVTGDVRGAIDALLAKKVNFTETTHK